MKIVLICAGGMSSSILSQRMEEEIKRRGLDATISAHGAGDVQRHAKGADVVLVGPQIRYQIEVIRKHCPLIPVDVINMTDYGMARADNVLDHALRLIEEHKHEGL